MIRWLCTVVCLAAVGCNVASVNEAPSTTAQNQCASDAECGPGGVCAGKQCRSPTGQFDTILFEVTPPADASAVAGVQFLKELDGLPLSGGGLDLSLDVGAQVTAEVTLGSKCVPVFDDQGNPLAVATDGSVPALVSVTPSAQVLGLFSSATVAQTILTGDGYRVSFSVPPGDYDIYVEPKHQTVDPLKDDGNCYVPPQLLRKQTIKSGKHQLNVALPEPSLLEFHVAWPVASGSLASWTADMLDPTTGRVISNRATLQLGKSVGSTADYVAKIAYLPVGGDPTAAKASELVRLSPPDGLSAPTILLARSALGLFSPNSGTLSQFTSLPTPVHVQGQVTAAGSPMPAVATLTLIATKITGIDPGVFASFVRTTDTDANGKFELDLLPGTYRVNTVPTAASGLAEASPEWTVATAPAVQAGKLIQLDPTLLINGRAVDSSGKPVVGAQVQAEASPGAITTDVLRQALGEATYIPRAAAGIVDTQGTFSIQADPGTFDVSVRPMSSTGYAWLVRANVAVGTTPGTMNGLGLGSLTLPLPVSYRGTVTLSNGDPTSASALPGSLIRAYIYMSGGTFTDDRTKAESVLQVAETRADDSGAFELLIPAQLNNP